MEIQINKLAYCKMFLHLAKYPYSACNGLLLTKKKEETDNNCIKYIDCIPLFHSSLTLNPAFEIALLQIDSYCQENELEINGFYHANQNANDKKPNLICAKIAEKLKENCNNAFLFLINNDKIHPLNKEPCYDIYNFVDQKLSLFEKCKSSLDDENVLGTCLELLKKESYKHVYDFDNHLDDISVDWKNNNLNKIISKTN